MRLPGNWHVADRKGGELEWLWESYLEELFEEGRVPVLSREHFLSFMYRMDSVVASENGMFAFARMPVRTRLDVHGYAWNVIGGETRERAREMLEVVGEAYGVCRLESCVPVGSRGLLRFLARLGFRREGVVRSGVVVRGECMDGVQCAKIVQ